MALKGVTFPLPLGNCEGLTVATVSQSVGLTYLNINAIYISTHKNGTVRSSFVDILNGARLWTAQEMWGARLHAT